jgi:putative YhdH/YhfP family quinone oxidoreductase
MQEFTAFRIFNDIKGYRSEIVQLTLDDLSAGDVVIEVHYSSVNYKDALAGTGKGKILRQFPLNGGIDCSGIVLQSDGGQFKIGDSVLVTGSGLSETLDGGYSQVVRVPHQHVIKLPENLSLRDVMVLGTAGFTAGLALLRMLDNRQMPELGPIAINGATGGVGMLATGLFSRAGFDVHAISGKPEYADYLKNLGAKKILSRESVSTDKAMDSVEFGGAVDSVGGKMLSSLLAKTAPYGNVASCGLVSSADLNATVMPFIIRGVSLLGIASAGTERAIREKVWQILAKYWDSNSLQQLSVQEISLHELDVVFDKMLKGLSFGRCVVKLHKDTC